MAFCKIVLVAAARVRRRGQVQAQGSPCDHATLGPLEERLDAAAGQGVIDRIAAGARLAGPVKGGRKRLLAVVVAVSRLAHREDDPAGHTLLQVASVGR